jgi:hypothetical protein
MPSRSLNDRLLGLGDHRLLPGDQLHLGRGLLDLLLVLRRLAHAHVEHDLLEARHLQRVLVAELVRHRLDDAVLVLLLQARRVPLVVGISH